MGKKLSRSEFEKLATSNNVGALDTTAQQKILSKEDVEAFAAAPIAPSNDVNTEYHEHADSQYGKGYLQAEHD